jgi:hypothetical protein
MFEPGIESGRQNKLKIILAHHLQVCSNTSSPTDLKETKMFLVTSYEEMSAVMDELSDIGGDDNAERFAGEADDPYWDCPIDDEN